MNPLSDSPTPAPASADLDAAISALEPDQIVAAKQQHHLPRRRLTPKEAAVFWLLRLYLVFMVGVVIYQIWTATR